MSTHMMTSRVQNIIEKTGRLCKRYLGIMTCFIAWLALQIFRRDLLKRHIWLVCEKRSEARDNGYHFYRYLKNEHSEIESYYVITKDSSDYTKISALGEVIHADSFKHCLYYLAAEKDISSQAYGAYPFTLKLQDLKFIEKLCRRSKKTVFLQHGITKDELSHEAFDYDKANLDFFVTSAPREYDFIKENYGYPENNIGCVGMSRFDHLHAQREATEKIILIMPTWRMWFKREKDGVPLKLAEKAKFMDSEFYRMYYSLLNDRTFQKEMADCGYKAYFYMHFQMQDYTPLFAELNNDLVIIADRYHYDVQDLLIRSKILVTDFSSVYFDFAYMNKPVVYYHFDRDQFTKEHYNKGYFDYERDGFGPCIKEESELMTYLMNLVRQNGAQPKLYEDRANSFFHIRDNRNCERTFEAINNLK